MNLQENIRRILREESEIPIYIKRRLSIIDKDFENLLHIYKKFKDEDPNFPNFSFEEFKESILTNVINKFIDYHINGFHDQYSHKEFVNFIFDRYQERLENEFDEFKKTKQKL